MAINGIITRKESNIDLYIDFVWERTSFSRDDNTSTILWKIVARDQTLVNGYSTHTKQIELDIDGQITTEVLTFKSSPIFGHETQTVAHGTRTIAHNADGRKDFSVNFKMDMYTYFLEFYDTFTLDRITRASGVTCTTVNVGVAPVITIDSQGGYLHTLNYGFGDNEQGYITGFIASFTDKLVIDNFVWPESFYQVMPNSKSGTGTIFCTTHSAAGLIVGEATRCNFTVNVNEGSSSPVFEGGYPKIKDTNSITKALTGDENKLVRYMSTAKVDIGAKGRNYATIARQKVKNGTAYHEEYTNDLVSISFGNVTSGLFQFELEDSRGFISKPGRDLSVAGNFIEYFHPTCNIGNNKPDTHGNLTINCSGSWFNESFGAVNNSLTAQYRYRLASDEWQNTESEWHDMEVSAGGNSYDATASLTIPNFDYTAGYVYEARVTDKLFTAHSVEYEVKSAALFSWSSEDFEFNVPVKFNAGAEGVGGGGADLSQYALKTDIPAALPNPYGLTINGVNYDGSESVSVAVSDFANGGTINGDLRITGNLRLKGGGDYGNTIYFGDSSYATISEPKDDTLTLKAGTVNLEGNIQVNGAPLESVSAKWTPFLNASEAVITYEYRQGWYQRVGNVVTLGFLMKINCKSGYHNTSISLNGIPYTPTYDASGGGVCSGAYVSAGFNFECWVVGTNGTITGRVQSCNNTTATNLNTSASGLFYPNGGGMLTLGGTICYITTD